MCLTQAPLAALLTAAMNPLKLLLGLTFVLPFLVAPGFAAGKGKGAADNGAAAAKAHKLSEWHFGQVLFGDSISAADLKDKVVVIENWGVHCPPCIASLPHMAELDKKYRDKGLRIIGAESQGSPKEAIKPLLERAKVEYTITAGANGPIPVIAIPRCFIFDGQGALVYDGYPSGPGFENAIKDSLRKTKAGGGVDAVADAAADAKPVAAADPKAAAATSTAALAPDLLISMRAWTNSDGREIRAAVRKVDAAGVTFVLPSGKDVVYPMDKLSDDSRSAITAVMELK